MHSINEKKKFFYNLSLVKHDDISITIGIKYICIFVCKSIFNGKQHVLVYFLKLLRSY